MRWNEFRRSENIEDRRGMGGGGPTGSGFGLPIRGGHIGIGSIIILLLVGWLFGIDPTSLIADLGDVASNDSSSSYPLPSPNGSGGERAAPNDQAGQFVAAVLGDTEDRWRDIFASVGQSYQPPKLVLFSGATASACGSARSASGPFYCPNDRRIYLDTAFFRQIETRLRGCPAGSGTCQFSEAYVIAHEVGHHVQNLMGILPKARQLQRAAADDSEVNQIQVRLELQADCFAGVWANRSEQKWKFLDPGDVQAALQTASAIGDDTLQKRAQGFAVPDAFTHGSAAQRVHWFTAGFKDGTVKSCNTFAATQL